MAKLLMVAVVLGCAASTVANAQWLNYPTPGVPRLADGKPDLNAPAPGTPDGKPDLSGIWRLDPPAKCRNRLECFMADGAVVPAQAWAKELFDQRMLEPGVGRPAERCIPHGIPDAFTVPGPIKFVQIPGVTFILYEEFNHFRQVFTDGRGHPTEMSPAWLGYSVGRWEGEVFVVESKGFNDKSWLDDRGWPHTEVLTTIERFRRVSVGRMDVDVTIDDPKAYTKPFTVSMRFTLMPDTELMEFICENHNYSVINSRPVK